MSESPNALDLLIHKLEQQSTLDADDRSAIRALPVTVRQMEAGSYIIRDGQSHPDCAVLMSGFAFRHKLAIDGGRQIVSFHVPGEALDFQHLFLAAADHNVQALTHVDLASVPRRALHNLIDGYPNIGRAISVSNAVESSIYREWLLNIGRRDGRRRIAHLLCEFAFRLNAQGLSNVDGYHFPMTQEQMADATGLTSVHVNRMLRGLEDDGLLTRKGRSVNFPNIEKLRDIADFNSRYLHGDNSRQIWN